FGKALSADNKATVQKFIAGMGDGSINLFKGAITLQDGTVYVKDGATAAPKEIWYLPQLLQGMTGQSVQTK
ncbi:MAG: BMP family ABC transporter substrate-binding protein, partial [Acidobacteriota bacterium]